MALIISNAIDPKASRYGVPELATKDFHSRISFNLWKNLTHRRCGLPKHIFTFWTDDGELIDQPDKIVHVTGLWICGVSYHTWTKLQKPLGWGLDFGLIEESGIIAQKIALPKKGSTFAYGDKVGIVSEAYTEHPPDDFPKTHITVKLKPKKRKRKRKP